MKHPAIIVLTIALTLAVTSCSHSVNLRIVDAETNLAVEEASVEWSGVAGGFLKSIRFSKRQTPLTKASPTLRLAPVDNGTFYNFFLRSPGYAPARLLYSKQTGYGVISPDSTNQLQTPYFKTPSDPIVIPLHRTKLEPDGAANGSQPNRSEINRT